MIPQAEPLSYLGAFLAGVVVSFSPCIWPLIPVTLSFIGVKAAASRIKGLFLSLVYVLGLAVTYSILGMVASLTGRFFGEISLHPVSLLLVGNAFIIAGLSFLDVINLGLGGLRLENKIKRTGGYFSTFLVGLVSGLAITPCTVAPLGAILVYVSTKQNILYGASLLFVFAYGMGFLLILVGTFSALFINLAKSALWLGRIKKICGFILIIAGEYFIIRAGNLMQ